MLWGFAVFAKFGPCGAGLFLHSGGVATDNLRLFGLPKRRTVLGGMAALAATPVLAADGLELKLRLLETSDLHTFDAAHDYYRDQPDASVGLTRVATLIRAARAGAQNVLLFDNGDIIQGKPDGGLCRGAGEFSRGRGASDDPGDEYAGL